MKKFLLIIAVVALCLSIVACDGKNGDDQTTEKQNNSQAVEASKGQEKQTEETSKEQEAQSDEGLSVDSSTEAKDSHVVVSSTKTELKAGDEFTLTVSVKNNPGIWAFMFELPINTEVLEFVSADISESICTMFGVCDYDKTTSSYKFNGLSSSPLANITADGTVVTITLKVKDNVTAGEYLISANPDAENIINVDGDFVEFAGASISINITK